MIGNDEPMIIERKFQETANQREGATATMLLDSCVGRVFGKQGMMSLFPIRVSFMANLCRRWNVTRESLQFGSEDRFFQLFPI